MIDIFGNRKRDAEIAALKAQVAALQAFALAVAQQMGGLPPVKPQGGGGPGPIPK